MKVKTMPSFEVSTFVEAVLIPTYLVIVLVGRGTKISML